MSAWLRASPPESKLRPCRVALYRSSYAISPRQPRSPVRLSSLPNCSAWLTTGADSTGRLAARPGAPSPPSGSPPGRVRCIRRAGASVDGIQAGFSIVCMHASIDLVVDRFIYSVFLQRRFIRALI
ncbi:hypothetical protein SORBI_3006G037150 [Sorghum bicolor]|uniref:Uncharacterized protein n=1 Tax=Sorghum bicolor TaxID=4558 RepID=A0A1Z5RC22_SORBI|nr:hypothetical protein SORBI_3006G037150 [Sorghum bicolor]